MFGDGSDGAAAFDGSTVLGLTAAGGTTYTLNRCIFCTDITVVSGKTLNTAGYRIFCKGTLTNNGTISNAGNAGAPGAGGAAGGAGGAAGTGLANNNDVGGSTSGGTGGTGATSFGGTGLAGTNTLYATGGGGGNGGNGGDGASSNHGTGGAGGVAAYYRPLRALTYNLQSNSINIS